MDIGEYNGIVFELGIRDTSALVANFHRADAGLAAAMVAVVDRNLDVFDTVWHALTPVDTGRMRRLRHIRRTRSGLAFEAGWDAAEFFAEGQAFYPFFQEFGTSRHRAQPSLGPAYRYMVPHFQADMRDVLRATINRLGR